MSVVRVNQIQDTSTNVAANISGGVVTFTNTPINAGGGKVLQAIPFITTTGSGAVTSSTAVLSGSITPSSTSSKIFITAQGSGQVTCGSSGIFTSDLWRGSISGTLVSRFYEGMGAGVNNGNTHYITFVHAVTDSPNTTSSQTYTVSINKGSGGTTNVSTIGSSGHPVVMTLMEIGA
tara:strand:+ start:1430 stop:1960 length:531 start_codon:yes stop_codon:yes gene_type:complete